MRRVPSQFHSSVPPPFPPGSMGPKIKAVIEFIKNGGSVAYISKTELFEETLAIREELLGGKHREVASALNNLGNLSYAAGQYEAAKTQYHQAREIFETALGPDDPDVARTLNNLAILEVFSVSFFLEAVQYDVNRIENTDLADATTISEVAQVLRFSVMDFIASRQLQVRLRRGILSISVAKRRRTGWFP